MKREYTIVWLGWFVLGLVLEIIGVGRWWWLTHDLLLAAIEGIAVWRIKRGDTLSEHVWWWVGESKPGRATMAGGIGLWISWHVFILNPSIGMGILSASLCAWLVPHFYTRGRTG